MAASLMSLAVTYFITMATSVDKWDIDSTICRNAFDFITSIMTVQAGSPKDLF